MKLAILRLAAITAAAIACVASPATQDEYVPDESPRWHPTPVRDYQRERSAYVMGFTDLTSVPVEKTMKDPAAKLDDVKTFVVVERNDPSGDPLVQRTAMFIVRNAFEARGYRHVSGDEKPDVMVTALLVQNYHEEYIPPTVTTIPVWNPGQSYSITTTTTASATASAWSNGGFGFGSATTASTTRTTVRAPGSWGTETVVTPGRKVKSFVPAARVDVYDGRSGTIMWSSLSAASSETFDERRAGQALLLRAVSQFPFGPVDSVARELGMNLRIVTLDGNRFLPFVLEVEPGSRAARAGIRVNDALLGSGDFAFENKNLDEVEFALAKVYSGKGSIFVSRDGEGLRVKFAKAENGSSEPLDAPAKRKPLVRSEGNDSPTGIQ